MRRDLVIYLEDYGNTRLEVKDVASIIEFNSLDSIKRSPYGQGIFRGILNNPFSDEELYDLRESLLSSGNLYYDQSFENMNLMLCYLLITMEQAMQQLHITPA